MPTLELNPGIPADVLELKILSISNLKMPDGWKASDGATFVTYEFPFPHDAHQIGRSQIVYKTDNPGKLINFIFLITLLFRIQRVFPAKNQSQNETASANLPTSAHQTGRLPKRRIFAQ